MNYYSNSHIAAEMIGLCLLKQAERFMDTRSAEGITSESAFKEWLTVAMSPQGITVIVEGGVARPEPGQSKIYPPIPASTALDLYVRVTKLKPVTPVTDLYELPQYIVVKFWRNFEETVKKMDTLESKHKLVDTVLGLDRAQDRIKNAFYWGETPEGHDYWNDIYDRIVAGEFLKK